MLPILLGLGLLGANEMMRRRGVEAKEAGLAEQYRGLLGAPAQAMGPEAPDGSMGRTGGTGLLADPTNPANQLQFAAGVAGLPGQQARGLEMLNSAFGRAQQGQQFAQSEARQGAQYGQSLAQSGEHFDRSYGLQQQQQQAAAAQHQLQAQQWLATFEAQRAETAQRLGMDRQRLGMEGERMQMAREAAAAKPDGAGALSLPKGYMPFQSASGVVAMPIPGTDDYAKAVGTQSDIASAAARVNRMRDLIEGKESTVNGVKVRSGGQGSELFGPKAQEYTTLYSSIVADVAKLYNKGVLQQGEMEEIQRALPNPSDWGAGVTGNKRMGKAYADLADQWKVKGATHVKANPWLAPALPAGAELVK
jgi:hypothetical protein